MANIQDWQVVDAIHAADADQLARYVRAMALCIGDGELILPPEWDHDPDYKAGLQKIVQAATGTVKETGKRYRFRTPTRTGHWCPTSSEARKAAVRAGVAYEEEVTGTIYLDVFVEIEAEELK